jgi:2-keto-3-deoxy-6-phosphogluconate aldolase
MVRLKPKHGTLNEDMELAEDFVDDEGIPPIESRLRHNILRMPQEIQRASGIVVYGRTIRSLIFSTDIAVIRNCDADAVFCVYPFTAQRAVSAAVIHAASIPVFVGVGGGTTQGMRAVYLAMDAENQGAMGVVLNAPIPNRDLRRAARVLDIPIVITVTTIDTDVKRRIDSGATILNVAGGAQTPEIVTKIREQLPKVPIIASGGRTAESINKTIDAGANAIVYSPPSSGELFRELMDSYR